jgi:hypothetical protein
VTLETSSRDTSAPYTSARCAWISPVVRPLAYSDKIAVPDPPTRRTCLGTTSGSKLLARSRGTAIRTGPAPVCTVFALCPFREFGDPRPAGSPLS